MERAIIAIVASLTLLVGISGPALCQNWCGMPPPCPPQPTYVTKMVPCLKTDVVAQVIPTWRTVPVKKVGYKCQKVVVRGTPVGRPCGAGPCEKCCVQPFCTVVPQMVPFCYYENQKVPTYQVAYRKVCRQVMRPQTYRIDAYPLCR